MIESFWILLFANLILNEVIYTMKVDFYDLFKKIFLMQLVILILNIIWKSWIEIVSRNAEKYVKNSESLQFDSISFRSTKLFALQYKRIKWTYKLLGKNRN